MGQVVCEIKTVSLEVGVREVVGVGECVEEDAIVLVMDGAIGGEGIDGSMTMVDVGNLSKLDSFSEKESIKAPNTNKPDTNATKPPKKTPLNPQSPLRIRCLY
jgi:hypothetical protein